MTNQQYFNDLIAAFPALKHIILDEDEELVHIRMERFADYTIEKIRTNNISELQKCFLFQEERIPVMNDVLINALHVSYCESMLLGDCRNEMKQVTALMPGRLKRIYHEYEIWYNKLAGNSR